MTGDIESLKNKIQILTSGVEDEEEKVKQVIVEKCITRLWM